MSDYNPMYRCYVMRDGRAWPLYVRAHYESYVVKLRRLTDSVRNIVCRDEVMGWRSPTLERALDIDLGAWQMLLADEVVVFRAEDMQRLEKAA